MFKIARTSGPGWYPLPDQSASGHNTTQHHHHHQRHNYTSREEFSIQFMAEWILTEVAEQIVDAFIHERDLLIGVEGQLEWIEKELSLMHTSSLQQQASQEVERHASSTRNLVTEIDNTINMYLNKSAALNRRNSLSLKRLFARHKFAIKLEQIKVEIRKVSRKEGVLMAISPAGQSEASISVSCVIKEANLVLSQNLLVIGGFTKPVEDMIDEFLHLQGILKDLQEKGEMDERTNAWSHQVVEESVAAKKVLESFRTKREQVVLPHFNMASLILADLKFGRAINRIRNAFQNIYERRWRYGIGDPSERSRRPNSLNPKRRIEPPLWMELLLDLWRPVEYKSIRRDLELMQALIKDLQGKEGLDQRVLVWLDEIKDIKHHADNLLHFASSNEEVDTPRGILKNLCLVIKSLCDRPEEWEKIKQINSRILEVSERKWTYDIGKIEGGSRNSQRHLQEGESSITEEASHTWNTVESIRWELKLMKALFADVEPIEDQDERVKLWVEMMRSVAKDAQKLIDAHDTRNMAGRSGIRRYPSIHFKKLKLIEKICSGLRDISIIKSTYAIGGIEGRRGLNSTDETQHEILPAASAISETPTASTTTVVAFTKELMASIYLYLKADFVNNVELIKREQRLLDALFKDVGDQERLERTQKDWVEAMRAVAKDVNSAIEVHNKMTWWNKFQGSAEADKIESVASKIRDMPRRVPYGIKHIKRSRDSNIGSPHQATTPSFGLKEPDINLYDDLQAVKMQLLVDNEHHVIVIVGMEGIGKTTLAKLICEDDDIKLRFPYCAFSSRPSYERTVNDIKQSMSIQEQEGEVINAHACLIVLDDLGTADEWEKLKTELLRKFNGIRILITTRSLTFANHAEPTSVSHKLHLLSDDDSWLLFKHSLTIPLGLEQDIRTQVLIPSAGLPKTIVKVREQFSHVEPTREAWLGLLKTLKRNKEPWQHKTKSIIEGNIPLYWKLCLRVMTRFRTEFEIPVRRLIVLWIAEGVVRQKRGDPRNSPEESPESIAKRYLSELIDQNMVQVTKKKLNGEVKRCRLPHPLREVLRYKRTSHVVDHYKSDDPIFKNIHEDENILSLSCYQNVISFTSFDTREGSAPGEELGKFLNKCISSRCLMRLCVLDLENVFRPQLPKEISKLVWLRYLGLRWTYLETLPPFISKLLNLQILDVKHTSISTLPRSIWKMHQLRHLYLNECYRCRLASPRSRQTITDLQTLWGVFIDEDSPVKNGLDKLCSLKRLGLTSHVMASEHRKAMSSQLEAVADWVQKLKQLQSLRLKSLDESNQPWNLPLKPLLGHTSLSSIYFLGKIENDFFVSGLPQGLTDLTLSGSGLEEDPMRTLKDLTSLKILRLLGGSFTGRHMLCSSEGFLQLRVLKLWKLMKLEEWELRKGALPNLIDLEIRSCIKLKELPNGSLFSSTLPSLKLSGMPKEFIHTIKVNQIHEWDISDTSDTSAILTSKRPKKFADVKVDASTSQNLSLFEDPISAQESNSYDASNSFQEENVHQTQSTIPEQYRSSFHRKLWQYICDVSMSSDSPVPPISVTWSENRDACADGWQTPYIDRIKKIEDLMGNDVPTREIFTGNED
ncbi:hypothetical protein LguiA_002845 [Lonicera macranthoides]